MTAKFACDPGFHLQGHNILKCDHDGDTATYRWNGDIPRCVQESISGVNTTITTTPIINSVRTSQHLVPSTVYNTAKTSTGTAEDDGNYIPNQVEAGPTRSNHIPICNDLKVIQGRSILCWLLRCSLFCLKTRTLHISSALPSECFIN